VFKTDNVFWHATGLRLGAIDFLHHSIEKEVDVFYLYPTAWQKINKEETSNNCFNSTTLLSPFFAVAALGKNRAKIMCWQLEMNLLPVVY